MDVDLFLSVGIQEFVKSSLSGTSNRLTASSLSFNVLKLIPEKKVVSSSDMEMTDSIPSQSILELDTGAQIVPKAVLNEPCSGGWLPLKAP